MGGLVAARVLADFYDEVTVVERDLLPQAAANRRGVPQGRHVHALLGRGSAVLDDLFPAFTDELVGAGAPVLDHQDLAEAYFSFGGHESMQTGAFPSVPPVLIPSRPLLESLVRQRLRATENITLLEGYDVADLMSTAVSNRVTGALICAHNGRGEQALAYKPLQRPTSPSPSGFSGWLVCSTHPQLLCIRGCCFVPPALVGVCRRSRSRSWLGNERGHLRVV
jgi:2-polyprenyl-6-methoxyphenol hydroxylase-like FAD-dependent oxidoreductase